jgi:TonB family protein
MFELGSHAPKNDYRQENSWRPRGSQEPKQRRMMTAALALLLIALGFVLYRDRDFWFPDTQTAEDQQPASTTTATSSKVEAKSRTAARKKSSSKAAEKSPASPNTDHPSDAPIAATATRTVLPPLDVEVVAGNVHRTIHPSTNAVQVTLQQDPQQQSSQSPVASSTDTAAGVTNNAAERVQMSVDAAEIVSQPVKPGYPLLARQMKVQGSVILQANIGRDGLIQDLQVVSGPPILANAAQEAVKQWHFRPRYRGDAAIETQAKITVNFTISTN